MEQTVNKTVSNHHNRIFNTMTTFTEETVINAPIGICFDLARSIDLHQFTTRHTNEKAIAGCIKGLIEKDEEVTWEATHFFVRQTLTSRIVEMQRPDHFRDIMVKGAFRSINHLHSFYTSGNTTVMTDHFQYEVPYGFVGKIFNVLILKKYLRDIIRQRNEIIKNVAESGEWKRFLT